VYLYVACLLSYFICFEFTYVGAEKVGAEIVKLEGARQLGRGEYVGEVVRVPVQGGGIDVVRHGKGMYVCMV